MVVSPLFVFGQSAGTDRGRRLAERLLDILPGDDLVIAGGDLAADGGLLCTAAYLGHVGTAVALGLPGDFLNGKTILNGDLFETIADNRIPGGFVGQPDVDLFSESTRSQHRRIDALRLIRRAQQQQRTIARLSDAVGENQELCDGVDLLVAPLLQEGVDFVEENNRPLMLPGLFE